MPGFLDDYEPVEDRLRAFWSDHPTGRIESVLVEHGDGEFIVKAIVWRDEDGPVGATGFAHESVALLPANMKASALEVCETSAIGRALANLGYAPKGKRPSREEMQASAETRHSEPPSAEGDGNLTLPGDIPSPIPSEARSSDYVSEGEGPDMGKVVDPNPLTPKIAGPRDWAAAQRELKVNGTEARSLVLTFLKRAYGIRSLEEVDVDLLREATSAIQLAKRTVTP